MDGFYVELSSFKGCRKKPHSNFRSEAFLLVKGELLKGDEGLGEYGR